MIRARSHTFSTTNTDKFCLFFSLFSVFSHLSAVGKSCSMPNLETILLKAECWSNIQISKKEAKLKSPMKYIVNAARTPKYTPNTQKNATWKCMHGKNQSSVLNWLHNLIISTIYGAKQRKKSNKKQKQNTENQLKKTMIKKQKSRTKLDRLRRMMFLNDCIRY